MDQKQTQGQPKQGPDAERPGQQNWNERQTPNADRDPADGSRQAPGQERGPNTERGGRDTEKTRNSEDSGGISNRDLDSEMEEQEELPERGTTQSER